MNERWMNDCRPHVCEGVDNFILDKGISFYRGTSSAVSYDLIYFSMWPIKMLCRQWRCLSLSTAKEIFCSFRAACWRSARTRWWRGIATRRAASATRASTTSTAARSATARLTSATRRPTSRWPPSGRPPSPCWWPGWSSNPTENFPRVVSNQSQNSPEFCQKFFL